MDEPQTSNGLTIITRMAQRRPGQAKRLSAALAGDLPRLAGLAIEVAQATGDPMGTVLADLLRAQPEDCHTLAELYAQIPQRTVTLREAGYLLTSARLETIGSTPAERAPVLSDLAFRLNHLGRREESLVASREAVDLYRQLARADQTAFRGDLATALVNLGNAEAAAGHLKESAAASREAADIYRQLARGDPERWRGLLARSLDNLGVRLREVGSREEGLSASREAVDLFRQLARHHPDASLGDLAGALTNLGTALGELGGRDEGLAALREAAGIYAELSEGRPDAFLPDYAASLTDLGLRYLGMEQIDASVSHCRRAVDIYQQLASGRPEAFRPDLATSLQNLSVGLRRGEQYDDALVAGVEAISIRRPLAEQDPQGFLPDLAASLTAHSMLLGHLGRHEEACVVGSESVTIYRELAKERPALFRENLALSLEELSRRLEAAGRDDEHWRALMEAVSVRRRLARNRWGLPRISKVVLTILAQVLIMWLLRRNRRRSRNASGAAAGARHETASAADTVYSEQLTTRPPFDRFSNAAKQVLQSAETEAKSDGSNYIGTEHLLLALLKHTDSSASTLLMECSVQYSTVREMLTRVLDERESAEIKQLIPTSRVRRVLDLALGEASRMGCERVGTEHLLLGLVIEAEGIAAHVLHDYGITTNTLLTRSTLCIEDGTGYDQV